MKTTSTMVLFTTLALLMAAPSSSARGVDGSIRIKTVDVGQDSIKIVTVAKNTGDRNHEFPVGCSLQRRNGSWYDIRFQLHELDKAEEKEVVFQARRINVKEFVLVRVAIWDRARSDGLLDTRYDMDERPIPRN
ncbi:MAG: hypothetical protein GY719_42720 [bacterium]|nr:hypothetical protein [bacterium]